MKILLANKFYYRRGGAEVYVLNLESFLQNKGHEVAIFTMQYPENQESLYKQYFPSEVSFNPPMKNLSKTALRPIYSNEVIKNFTRLLGDFQPDVVHLSNVHSQLSPAIAAIAHKRGIKVVWTLHDYKLLCPRYDCLQNGKMICEECFFNKHNVLKHNCMKNSLSASIIAYLEAVRWNRKRLEKYTDIFICPSQFMANKMIQGGFDKNKMRVLCNFMDTEKTVRNHYDKENYYCYVGRLSHEKGVETLLSAAKTLPYKLKVIGGGELREKLEQSLPAASEVELLGYKQWDEIKEIVGRARFVVIPSEWYENNPFSVIEAQCLGTPVLGANIGGIPELIDETNGMLFESRNVEDLQNKIKQMVETEFDYQSIAKNAQQRYSAENYYNEILKIYNSK